MSKRYWFVLNTPTSDPFNPTSYSRINWKPCGCTPGSVIEAIYAKSGNIYPFADHFANGQNLYNYLTDAILSPYTPQPTSGKIFVYTKPSV